MHYATGDEIRLGDRVELWPGAEGEVVAVLDSREFLPAYPESEWAYLKTGILVETGQAGLIHFLKPDQTMILIDRWACHPG
jgi:hypothetical protein